MHSECDLPGVRSHVAVRLSNHIIVFAGKNEEHKSLSHFVIWMYNVNTEHWRKHVIPGTKLVPPMTCKPSAVAIGSDIYMFGGCVYKDKATTNALWKLRRTSTQCFDWSKVIAENEEEAPSPRYLHSGWEYAEKLWTFGGVGAYPNGYLYEHGYFVLQRNMWYNNQLLCFDTSTQEWRDVKSSGTIPQPRSRHATCITNSIVWLYGGMMEHNHRVFFYDDLYQLNLQHLIWTKIITCSVKPSPCCFCSFNTATDSQLVLHGLFEYPDPSTWVLDVPSLTWKQHRLYGDYKRYSHTGTESVSGSIFIIGGILSAPTGTQQQQYAQCRIISLKREPKSLQKVCMKVIYVHRDKLPWRALPEKLIAQIMFPTNHSDHDE